MTNNYYGPYAYRSTYPRKQPAQTTQPKSAYGSRLPWGYTEPHMPFEMADNGSQQLALQEDQRLAPYQPNIPPEHWAIYNHEYLQNHGYRKISVVLHYILGSSKAMALFISFCMILPFFLTINSPNKTSTLEAMYGFLKVFVIFPGVFYYLWGITILVKKYCPQILTLKAKGKAALKWRLNRRTGMVSKFELYDGKVIEKTAPFDEFDAYLMVIPHRHGFAYNMIFSHRYQGWEVDLGQLVGFFTNRGTIENGWEFLQNYMDISKPLPDYVVLEAYRHLDPVTAEYDQQTGRNPRYLRDMSEKELTDFAAKVAYPYNDAMDHRPCLFAEQGYVNYLAACGCYLDTLEPNQPKEP